MGSRYRYKFLLPFVRPSTFFDSANRESPPRDLRTTKAQHDDAEQQPHHNIIDYP